MEQLEEFLNSLDSIEIIESRESRARVRNKTNTTHKTNTDTIEIPKFESLSPLTKRLIRLGILKLQNVKEVLETEKEAEDVSDDFTPHFDFMGRKEEMERLKEVLENQIQKIRFTPGHRGFRIPFFAFRHLRPELQYGDIEQLAKELQDEHRDVRVEFEDGFLNVFVLKTD